MIIKDYNQMLMSGSDNDKPMLDGQLKRLDEVLARDAGLKEAVPFEWHPMVEKSEAEQATTA